MRDNLYSTEKEIVEAFRFDDNVASVFEDMLNRSVPGYATLLSLTGIAASKYVQPGSSCYDLGCSVGASTLVMDKATFGKECFIYGVDSSMAMIEKCKSQLADQFSDRVNLICSDIREIEITNASFVVLNLTLQFVPQPQRLKLLSDIYQGMQPGSALLLSEKIRVKDGERDNSYVDWYYDFKRANGYSDLEIAQKRNALEEVLVLDTPEDHEERLLKAGFSVIYPWFQALNFMSFLAVKS